MLPHVLKAERAQHTEVVPRYGSAMIARIDALSGGGFDQ
jgi:hypothetical protein